MIVMKTTKEDLPQIAEFMYSSNLKPEMRCAYIGSERDEILEYLIELYEENHMRMFYVKCHNSLVGVIAGDICEDNHTVEVIGPFVSTDADERLECACGLIDAVQAMAPQYHYTFFVDAANSFIKQVIETMKGKQHGEYYDMSYELTRAAGEIVPSREYKFYENSKLEPKHISAQIEALHNQLFSGSYYNGKTILEHTDEKHWLIYCLENDVVVSYATFNTEDEDGYLDFIGTHPDYRNRGYASDLLKAMTAILAEHPCSKVNLCTSGKNAEAIQMYQAFGFKTMSHNLAYNLD